MRSVRLSQRTRCPGTRFGGTSSSSLQDRAVGVWVSASQLLVLQTRDNAAGTLRGASAARGTAVPRRAAQGRLCHVAATANRWPPQPRPCCWLVMWSLGERRALQAGRSGKRLPSLVLSSMPQIQLSLGAHPSRFATPRCQRSDRRGGAGPTVQASSLPSTRALVLP